MTAAHAQTSTKHVAQHAAGKARAVEVLPPVTSTVAAEFFGDNAKTSLRSRLGAKVSNVHLPKRSVKRAELFLVSPTAPQGIRVVNTGKADFTVDASGSAERTLLAKTADGYITFANAAAGAAESAFPSNVLAQIFESPERRQARFNVQSVVQTMLLVGQVAAKVKK